MSNGEDERERNSLGNAPGGWRGLNLADDRDSVAPPTSEEEAKSSTTGARHKNPLLARYGARFPRSYHILFLILVPLFFLIGLCFLCGYLMALWESDAEKATNDAVLAGVVEDMVRIQRLVWLASATPKLCLEAYEGEFSDTFALAQHMEDCGEATSNELKDLLDELTEELTIKAYSSLSFDWISCREGLDRYADRSAQAEKVINAWKLDFETLSETYRAQNLTDAEDKARQEATGHDSCRANAAAGALFWFTIMSTIGYGNTAPSTIGGRTLVYTLGFLSILIFTALIGQAGFICLFIVEDFFHRINLKRFTKGVPAVLFWAGFFVLWITTIAGVAWWWGTKRSVIDSTDGARFHDAYWFAYISVTTVGLGDIYMPHDRWRAVDMFYLPLMFLVGFVLLTNFLVKLSNVLTARGVYSDSSLESILRESRRGANS